MSKIYFVFVDRNDTTKGYKQVSKEYVMEYVHSFKEGRPYFINLGYAIMETNEVNYRAFYKDLRRKKYLREESELAGGTYPPTNLTAIQIP